MTHEKSPLLEYSEDTQPTDRAHERCRNQRHRPLLVIVLVCFVVVVAGSCSRHASFATMGRRAGARLESDAWSVLRHHVSLLDVPPIPERVFF